MMPLYNDRQHFNPGAGGYLSLHDNNPSHPAKLPINFHLTIDQ